MLQYIHLIPTPVERTSAMPGCAHTHGKHVKRYEPHTLMTHVACETTLLSVVRSSIYSCPGNLVAIGRAVVYYARLPMHLVQELNVVTVYYI